MLFIVYQLYLSKAVPKKESPGWCGSGLSAGLWIKGSPVRFPVRAHAWVAGQVPGEGYTRGNHTLMFLSHSFSLPSPLSKNKQIRSLKKKTKQCCQYPLVLLSWQQFYSPLFCSLNINVDTVKQANNILVVIGK